MNAKILALMLATAGAAAYAQPVDHGAPEPRTKGVSTLTRGVVRFGRLENALADAVAHRDHAAAEPMLADDFELRLAARPGDPVPRAQFLDAIAARGAPETTHDQMAVHDLGEHAVVSFRSTPEGGAPELVVDLWSHEGESWRLAVRYVGGVGDDRGVPGNVPTGALEKRGE